MNDGILTHHQKARLLEGFKSSGLCNTAFAKYTDMGLCWKLPKFTQIEPNVDELIYKVEINSIL